MADKARTPECEPTHASLREKTVSASNSDLGSSVTPAPPVAEDHPATLIQPRDHKAKVCIWADISVHDMDTLYDLITVDDIKQVLAELFALGDYRENPKSAILLDLFFFTYQFARTQDFSKEQASAFFSIVKKTHEVAVETPFGNVEQTFSYFRELVLRHAVKRPPHSIDIFTPNDVKKITEYVINTYFRHYKMYKYVFTPKVSLDLSMVYEGMPESPTPPASQAAAGEGEGGEGGEGAEAAEGVEGGEVEKDGEEEAKSKECEEPELSEAAKELRDLMKKHLSSELVRIKATVEDQMKASDSEMEKRLQEYEGAAKGGRSSAKGKKK